MLTPLYTHVPLLHVSGLKRKSSGNTDTFCGQGQQNVYPDVNIRFKSSVLCISNCCHLLVLRMKKCDDIRGRILLRNINIWLLDYISVIFQATPNNMNSKLVTAPKGHGKCPVILIQRGCRLVKSWEWTDLWLCSVGEKLSQAGNVEEWNLGINVRKEARGALSATWNINAKSCHQKIHTNFDESVFFRKLCVY